MSVLPVRFVPDPVLKRKAQRVPRIDAPVKRLVRDMVETMHSSGGIGLAANQVGSLQRVVVIQFPEEEPLVLINPRVVRREGERELDEGCLSIPGYQGRVKRSIKVRVRAQDLSGREIRLKAEDDLLAQALEHEIDHLNGVLYIDRLASEDSFWKLEPGTEAGQVASKQPPDDRA